MNHHLYDKQKAEHEMIATAPFYIILNVLKTFYMLNLTGTKNCSNNKFFLCTALTGHIILYYSAIIYVNHHIYLIRALCGRNMPLTKWSGLIWPHLRMFEIVKWTRRYVNKVCSLRSGDIWEPTPSHLNPCYPTLSDSNFEKAENLYENHEWCKLREALLKY
jgi:hypothetical protein